MAINLSAIKNELLPGLAGVTGKYKEYPAEWKRIFTSRKSNMNFERTTSMRFMGLAQVKNDGSAISFDNNAGERYLYTWQHIQVALGYSITRLAIEDNLYKTEFNPSNLGLQKSFNQTREIYGANVFNTGTTYNSAVGGDGVALFSTAHPIDGMTIANKPSVEVDLNESSMLSGMVAVSSTYRDNAGLLNATQARKLIIPPALEPVAIRLTKTELRPGTADNDVNAIKSTAGGLPDGYLVNHYLTSSYAWFLQTDVDGLVVYERTPFEMNMDEDFTTMNLLVSGYERYSYGYLDWRAVYGSFPTS